MSPGNGPPKGIGDGRPPWSSRLASRMVTGERTAERHWRPVIVPNSLVKVKLSHRGTDRRKALETELQIELRALNFGGSPGNGPPKGIGDTACRARRSHWARSPGNGPPKGIGDTKTPADCSPVSRRVTGERTAERHWRRTPPHSRTPSHSVTGERTAERHWRPRHAVR